jgi:hypothetical protein
MLMQVTFRPLPVRNSARPQYIMATEPSAMQPHPIICSTMPPTKRLRLLRKRPPR